MSTLNLSWIELTNHGLNDYTLHILVVHEKTRNTCSLLCNLVEYMSLDSHNYFLMAAFK